MSEAARGASRIVIALETPHVVYRQFANGKVKLKVVDNSDNDVLFSFASADECAKGKARWDSDVITADEHAVLEAILDAGM